MWSNQHRVTAIGDLLSNVIYAPINRWSQIAQNNARSTQTHTRDRHKIVKTTRWKNWSASNTYTNNPNSSYLSRIYSCTHKSMASSKNYYFFGNVQGWFYGTQGFFDGFHCPVSSFNSYFLLSIFGKFSRNNKKKFKITYTTLIQINRDKIDETWNNNHHSMFMGVIWTWNNRIRAFLLTVWNKWCILIW